MGHANHRLFFAVELEPALKTRLLTLQQEMSDVVASPVPGENFHITLNFLGQVSDKKLEMILDNIQAIPLAPFAVHLTDLIYWPKPKIVAVALDDSDNQLLACKKQIDEMLSQIDYFQREKRPYIPHITLFRQVDTPPEENILIDATIKVSQVSLMVSQSSRKGVSYSAIESWPLKHPSIKRQLLGE